MNRYKKIVVLLLGLSLFTFACVQLKKPRNKIEFYSLEYDSPQIKDMKQLPLVIRMNRFSVAPEYNTNRIIYRGSSFKKSEYTYHKWRANPGDLITYFLSRDVKQSRLFKAVIPHDSGFPSSHVLEGSVDEFFERDTKEGWEAVLSLTITLMVENEPDITRRILFQKTYITDKACKLKNPRALAEAMSRAMAEVSGRIIQDIYDQLAGS